VNDPPRGTSSSHVQLCWLTSVSQLACRDFSAETLHTPRPIARRRQSPPLSLPSLSLSPSYPHPSALSLHLPLTLPPPSLSLLFPLFPLEVPPLPDCGYGVWGTLKLPSGSGHSLTAKRICHTFGLSKTRLSDNRHLTRAFSWYFCNFDTLQFQHIQAFYN